MVDSLINLRSRRAYEARLSKRIGKHGYSALITASASFGLIALALALFKSTRLGFIALSPALLCLAPTLWWKRYLSILPVSAKDLTGRLSLDVLSNLKPNVALTPKNLWAALSDNWQVKFVYLHLLMQAETVAVYLEEASEVLVKEAFETALSLADQNHSPEIEACYVAAGLMKASPQVKQLLINYKGRPEDIEAVANWLGRNLAENSNRPKSNFGGIGRDWAFGYTPLLNRLGLNVSLSIAKHGSHFGWLTESAGVKAMESALANHASAIALVGPVGIGKTNSVYALAQRLIEGKTTGDLAYHQIISVNATDIVSNARGPGELEHIMISIANEAAHAGHIFLFLDDAEAFFGEGPGAFDGSQILQSIIQMKSVPMIIAFTPNGYQKLRSRSSTLASLLTPVTLQELDEAGVMRVLEDAAIGLENHKQVIIAYEALIETYRLSGRYDQDEAYPGKAISLLEQSISYNNSSMVTADSVQRAVEQARGIKVGSAAPAEASELLNLEDKIHQRMINQSHAVSVVANSLRRARAGVTNPKRPIGSFLFLGPTGVGKTELAKSLAATYFGAESNMIRLDMSEYQQSSDVSRLLSDGQNETKSLIMAERQQPFSVVLLDEIEKAHPNILNLLLQLLDEGQLTDSSGRAVSFKDSIIIATSNAGAQTIRERVDKGETLDSFESSLIEELIKTNQFKPELVNRFDEVVLFRPLNPEELAQIVSLMMSEINQTLANQNIKVSLSQAAVSKIVQAGYDPRLGARPMRRTLQKAVEDTIAQRILKNEAKPGDTILLDQSDLAI